MTDKEFELLSSYVPQESLLTLEKWFTEHPFSLKITKKRVTKYGDFRASSKDVLHQISVNSNLNEYAFLITLTHEFAHLLVWKSFKHKVRAHGKQWKDQFSILLTELIIFNVFPQNIELALKNHIINPPASSARDILLIKELKKFDLPNNNQHLADLPEGATFSLNNKRIFKKGKKRRTRYLCKEISTNKEYLVHGIAEVVVLIN